MRSTPDFIASTPMESYFYRFRGGVGGYFGWYRPRRNCRLADSLTLRQLLRAFIPENVQQFCFPAWSDRCHISTPDSLVNIGHSFSEKQYMTGHPGGNRERSPEDRDLFLGLPFLWSILRGSLAVEPRRYLSPSPPQNTMF